MEGITVHAAVRNPDNKIQLAHLRKAAVECQGVIKFFKADLLSPGTYREAMEGCELVFHTASPFTINVKNPQKDLIDPAVKGTENVLNSVNEVESVKRVVVTSSCAAMYTDAMDIVKDPGGVLNESIWNTTASLDYQPYAYSKTLAEKKAWEINKNQNRWDLVTINMSLVLGPSLNPSISTSESTAILKLLGNGELKMGAPELGLGVIDVRDVAEAHYLAAYKPEANGRYITSAYNTNLLELSLILIPKYGDKFPLPKRALPKWLLWIVGPLVNKLFSRKMIQNNVDIPFNADNSKIKRELGITFRSLKETMEDSFQNLIDEGILVAK